MLTIDKKQEGNKIILQLEGKLDTLTSPDLDAEINELPDDFQELILDFTKLKYISSAGLRVLLKTQQNVHEGSRLVITNVDTVIMDILEVTGFTDFLTIE